MTLIESTALYLAFIFLLAGAVKGVVGLGLPTVAMGLLSLRMPPAEAAALGLARDQLVQALGLSFTVSTVALGLGLLWHDALKLQAVSNSAIAVLPALLGMMLGARIRRLVSPERFRQWFFVGLGLLAIYIIHEAIRLR